MCLNAFVSSAILGVGGELVYFNNLGSSGSQTVGVHQLWKREPLMVGLREPGEKCEVKLS